MLHQCLFCHPRCSAAKAPFLARFRVKQCGVRELETLGLKDNPEILSGTHSSNSIAAARPGVNMPNNGPSMSSQHWQACIFKVGDDVRQDMLALQIIALFRNVVQQVGMDIYLAPYRVVATSPGVSISTYRVVATSPGVSISTYRVVVP